MQQNQPHSPTLADAMDRVIANLKAMSPEQLREKLNQHQGGMFSQIADDMEQFSVYLAENPNSPSVQALYGAMNKEASLQSE